MSSSISCSASSVDSIASAGSSQALSQHIESWNIEEKQVHVDRISNSLSFSIKEEGSCSTERLYSNLYEPDDVERYVHLFREVIGRHLKKRIQPGCFMPLFCAQSWIRSSAHPPIHLMIGLFANAGRREVEGASWAIVDKTHGKSYDLPLEEASCLAKQFIRESPLYNKPPSYSMHSYIQSHRFKLAVSFESDYQSVNSIFLRIKSVFDESQLINKEIWAVTLISSIGGPRPCGFAVNVGHAMIAYEGVDSSSDTLDGGSFLKCVHIQQRERVNQKDGVAVVEFTDSLPKQYVKGPTWLISKDKVEAMIAACRSTHFVNFSMIGSEYELVLSLMAAEACAFPAGCRGGSHQISWFKEMRAAREQHQQRKIQNCLDWSKRMLSVAGIDLPSGPSTPCAYVASLQ